MPEIVRCPQCDRQLRVPDNLLGQQVKCPTCGETFAAEVASSQPLPSRPAPEEELPEEAPKKRSRPAAQEDDAEGAGVSDRPSRSPVRRKGRARDDLDEERGYDEDEGRRGRSRGDYEPHRGGLILGLGIASIVLPVIGICCFPYVLGPIGMGLGIAAWLMGQNDRAKFRAGTIDPQGEGTTNGGWICGIIGTILGALVLTCGVVGLILFGFNMLAGMRR